MSKLPTAKQIAARFRIELAERYRRFLMHAEWKLLDGRFALVPMYASPMRLATRSQTFASLFYDGDEDGAPSHPSAFEAELGGAGGWVPLAELGDEEARFLVVRAADPACPVGMWEPDTRTVTPCAASLDAFVASIGDTAASAALPASPGAADLEQLRDAVNRTDAALAGRRTKAQLTKLEDALRALEPLTAPSMLPSQKALADDARYRGLPSRSLLIRAKALEALGRYADACDVLDNAIVDGEKVRIGTELLCRLLLEQLDRPARVIEICSSVDGRLSPLLRGLWALALLRLGDVDAAVQQLATTISDQVAAALALSPRTDRAKETQKRLTAVRAQLDTYAAKHGLEAAASRVVVEVTAGLPR